MAFEPVYDTARFDGYVRLATGQAVVEARLLPKPQTRIAKVLSAGASVDISAAESFTGEARYSGRVNFKVLFETSEGNADVLDYNADFSDKIVCGDITAASRTKFRAAVLDMDIIAAQEDVVKLAAVIEVALYVCENENIRYLTGGGQSVYVHEDRVALCSLVAEADETFIVSDTATDLDGCEILGAEADIITKSRESGEDCVTLIGEASVNLMLRDKSGMPTCRRIFIPVQQQCRAGGALGGDTVTGNMSVKNVSVTKAGGEDESESVAEIELAIKAEALVLRRGEITPVVDAFCLDSELLATVQSVTANIPKGDITLEERIDGNVEIDEKLPLADNVLGVYASRVTVSGVTAADGKVKAEGILGCSIVYYNAEQSVCSTVLAQIPFSVTAAADVCEDDSVGAIAAVKDVSVKILRGNELGVHADICFMLTPISAAVAAVISEIKLGEKKAASDAALSVHVASKDETVWSAAKSLGITPEEVVLQNPNLTFPCAGGERLVAYRRMMRQAK